MATAAITTPSAARTAFTTLARTILAAEQVAESTAPAAPHPSLARLTLADSTAHVGGTVLLALAPTSDVLGLSARDLGAGDAVALRLRGGGRVAARVWRITPEHVVVVVSADAIDEPDEALRPSVGVEKVVDEGGYRRVSEALDRLDGTRRHPVVDAMFGTTAPGFDAGIEKRARVFAAKMVDEGRYALNESQEEALVKAVAASSVAAVRGPPGTGKTTTVAAAVHACVRLRGERVLACAPSNVAADNIVEALLGVDAGLNVVRVGNVVRLSERVLERSLDELVLEEFGGIGRQIRRDVSVAQRVLWGRSGREEKDTARERLRDLRKEEKRRERSAVLFVLERADVVVTTCVGASARKLVGMRGASAGAAEAGREPDDRFPFDSVFVDEAANASEAAAWCAMLLGRRVVLAGDDRQLPPVVILDDGDLRRAAMTLTPFHRAKAVLGGADMVLLRRQYRMHQVIAQFSSEMFYNRKLLHDDSVKNLVLADLVKGRDASGGQSDFAEDMTHPLIFIDTAGCDCFEETEGGLVAEDKIARARERDAEKASKLRAEKGGGGAGNEDDTVKVHDTGSRLNAGEAAVVIAHVRNIVKCGVSSDEVACLSPYSAQCRRLRQLLDKEGLQGVQVDTVDGLQGREKEVVIFSATRSSENGGSGGIGFLSEKRRFNVALTRAKRSFTLVGDSATLAVGHELFSKFIDYVDRRTLGDYRSGFSYLTFD